MNDYDHSYKFHKKVYKIKRSHLGSFDKEIGEIFYWMAQDLLQMGNYEKALFYATNSLSIKRFYNEDKKLDIAELNFTLGVIQKYLGEYQEALRHLETASSLFASLRLTTKIGQCQLWQGFFFFYKKNKLIKNKKNLFFIQ